MMTKRKTRTILGLLAAMTLSLLAASSADASFVEYSDRATWEAALNNIVTENLNTITSDDYMNTPGDTRTLGTHTFTTQPGSTGNVIMWTHAGVQPDGTTCLLTNGQNVHTPKVMVSIPTSYGIGFDYDVTATSTGLSNSFYVATYGGSGTNTTLLNPVGSSTDPSFYGVIDDQGGIGAYNIYSLRTNYQSMGTDNFSYGTPEPATMSLLALGGLAVLKRRRRKA